MARAEGINFHFTTDLDGCLFDGPPPIKTKSRLKRGKFSIPDATIVEEKKTSEALKLLQMINLLFHVIRPFKSNALSGLRMLQEYTKNRSHVNISFSVLSGRDPALHEMTKRRIAKKLPETFANIWLNEGYSSGYWKEMKTREIVEQGDYIAHIEDDLEAALRMARVSETQVRVYLIRNSSNTSKLLGNTKIPENIIFIDFYSDAVNEILRFIDSIQVD